MVGYFIFVLDSNDGAKLYFDEILIADNDGVHGKGNPKTYMLPLEPGFYPIKIEFFQGGGETGLDLLYVKPNTIQLVPIPFDVLYSEEKFN